MQMKKQCFSWTAMRTAPRRHQLRLCAETGASRHTTQYFLVGCVHSALHHGDEAITPCPTPAQQRRILLSTWPPIQHRCGGLLVSAHSHNTNASHFFDVLRTCVPLSTRNLCRRPCIINWRHQSRFREMLLLMDYAAYVTLLGYPTATIALLLFNIVFSSGTLCVAIKWNLISHALPKTPLTTSSAQLLTLFTPPQEILILNYGQTFLPLSLSSHLDTLHYCMAPPRQPISLWRYIVQQLAGSHPHIEQSALPLKMALDISYLLSGNIPIAHTNAGGYGLPVGNGGTLRRSTGRARLSH
ncbi:hypothetical protein TCDM_10731 [Trypanosoma cruzi Dm28c]|uniref:Uncharacterized protein n=1 Tax=Trypanosoma cruzi Dm28c TaxID=1416333 RepID=V5BB98_TRYCR|nr:hypothetical protein TCDM_10731 [Trypanosoma cruzi Dm28c]